MFNWDRANAPRNLEWKFPDQLRSLSAYEILMEYMKEKHLKKSKADLVINLRNLTASSTTTTGSFLDVGANYFGRALNQIPNLEQFLSIVAHERKDFILRYHIPFYQLSPLYEHI